MRRNEVQPCYSADDAAKAGDLSNNSVVVRFLQHKINEATNTLVDTVNLVRCDCVCVSKLFGHLASNLRKCKRIPVTVIW